MKHINQPTMKQAVYSPSNLRKFKQLYKGLVKNFNIMMELYRVFPCSINDAKERFPELNFEPVNKATSKYIRVRMATQEALGISYELEPIHLLRHAIRLGGKNPVTCS